MKRLYACIALFMLLILMCLGSLFMMKKANEKLFALTDKASQSFIENGSARAEVEELLDYMDKYYIKSSYIAKTDLINDIYTQANRLKRTLKDKPDDFLIELGALKLKARIIYENQFPHAYSVF